MCQSGRKKIEHFEIEPDEESQLHKNGTITLRMEVDPIVCEGTAMLTTQEPLDYRWLTCTTVYVPPILV